MNLRVSGPESPDAVFRRAYLGEFDGVVALYHDQGLIPAKLLDFDSTVNLTAGLPVVRCSPDHGTAFSLAGRNVAKPDSLIAAIRLAYRLAKTPA
jgi:4-hydroxythreonine-4-phosphate dehydrogenase